MAQSRPGETLLGELKIISWNVNSWTVDNSAKRIEIIRSINPDIILLQETKLTGENKIELPGYVWFGNNRAIKNTAKCGSGGVAILVKNSVKHDYSITVEDKSFDGILILKLTHKINTYQIAIACVYLPPEAGEYGRNSDSFFNHLLSQSYLLSEVDLFLCGGDLNARINTSSDFINGVDDIPHRKILDESKNKHGDAFTEFLLESKMCIINGRIDVGSDDFTSLSKKGKAVVDYFFCPHSNLEAIQKFKVHRITKLIDALNIDPGKLPDHSVVECYIRTLNAPSRETVPVFREQQYGFKYKRQVPSTFLDEKSITLINETIHRIETMTKSQAQVDITYNKICQLYYQEIDNKMKKKHLPNRSNKRRGKAWWNEELEELWAEVSQAEHAFTQAKGQRRQHLYQRFKERRNTFDRRYNQIKRHYNRIQRDDIANLNTEDPKAFWNKIKQMGPKQDSTIPMEIPVGENDLITDPEQVLERWRQDFEMLYNRFNAENTDDTFLNDVKCFKENFENQYPINDPVLNDSMFNVFITESEVHKAIYKAKNNKAVGIDSLPNEVFKNQNSIKLWTTFFNLCFRTGLVPDIWAKAFIRPIPKGGMLDNRIPLNYRGISLLPTISKIYSSILNERLLQYLEDNELITDTQNGFRKLRSCVDHLYVLTNVIRNRKSKGLSTFVCYIDLSKAFDMIDRDCLFAKLATAGVKGRMYWAIRSLYSNHMSSLLINNQQTEWFHNVTGVKQGDNISTTLFALYLNDLAEEILNSGKGVNLDENGLSVSILMYADDIALVSDNEDNLQFMINMVHSWCSKWKMSLNTDKSKIVHYRKKSLDQSNFMFKYGNSNLSYCKEYKYLGCTLSQHLDFTDTASILSKASSRALGSILSKYKYFKGLDYNTFTKLYNTCVCTVMDYSSEIWGYKQYDKCDSVHNRAMRAFLGVHRFTSVPAISGDMKWLKPKYRRHVNIIRFWLRLTSLDDTRLTKKVFQWDKSCTKGNWYTDVKSILRECNLDHLICDNPVLLMSKHDILESVEHHLLHKQATEWKREVEAQPKLRFYKLFKKDFNVEPYVQINLPISHRSLLSQLRYGILPLRIETGRYINLPVEERKCLFCTDNVVETEMHFLFHCNLYNLLRTTFYADMTSLSTNFMELPDPNKLIVIFSKSNFIRKFAVYIDKCYKKRSSVLYK